MVKDMDIYKNNIKKIIYYFYIYIYGTNIWRIW
jgi:hypothetical protein